MYKVGERQRVQILRALSSDVRIDIMKMLAENPLNMSDIFSATVGLGYDLKYKETLYKAVDMLVKANLVEKYYDNNKKEIIYKSRLSQVLIDGSTMEMRLDLREPAAPEKNDVKTDAILKALGRGIRMDIVRTLWKSEIPMSAAEIYTATKEHGFDLKYRESIIGHLQLLVEADLLEKFYDAKMKRLSYRPLGGEAVIDTRNMVTVVNHSATK